jgi:hypothetical protein
MAARKRSFSRKIPNEKVGYVNRKVRGAQKTTFDGIEFKSKLEVFCYRKLKEYGIHFQYEQVKFTLFTGFKPTHLVGYFPDKSGNMAIDTSKLRDTTYTPDFVGDTWVVETKGKSNELYPLKLKLFRALLEEEKTPYKVFMEPHNQKQVLQCIEIIKELNK